jgi:adenylate cyclase
MAASIHIVIPKERTGHLSLSGSTTIGRLEQNALSFPEDPLISRQHALIRQQGAHEFVLIDLGSSNGTYVNSKLVVSPTALKHGDEVVVGSSLLTFQFPDQREVRTEQDSLTSHSSRTIVGIRLKQVVILVCDIRSFSRISELLSPMQLAKLLGNWFREVSLLVDEHKGILDKYIGDAFLAYWPVDVRDPEQAVLESYTVAAKLIALSKQFTLPVEANMPFKIGVGISQGIVASGSVGGVSQRDSSIMGDAVNIAFRLEALTKEKGYPLVISKEVYEVLKRDVSCNPLGESTLKGKAEPVEIYGIQIP